MTDKNKVQAAVGPLLLQVANSHLKRREPGAQLVENAIDSILALRKRYGVTEGASCVWVVMEKAKGGFGRIRVIDTGLGMVPTMDPGHSGILKKYLAGEGGITSGDLDALIPKDSYSRDSVERMLTKALLLPDEEIGAQGLGVASVWVLGKKVTYTICPHKLLAVKAGLSVGKDGLSEVFDVELPTAQDLLSNKMDYTIKKAEKPHQDPWGNPLTNGVTVTIEGVDLSLMRGSTNVISPARMVPYLTDRFSLFSLQGIEIHVIDRVSGPKEKDTLLQRPSYLGVPLYDGIKQTYRITVGGVEYPYDVELYYSLPGKSVPPAWLVREGAGICTLGEFSGFDHLPGAGSITGYISTPHGIPQEKFGLRTTDKLPNPSSPGVEIWVKHVKKYVYPKIEEAMEHRGAHEDTRAQRLMQDISHRINGYLNAVGGGMTDFFPHGTGGINDQGARISSRINDTSPDSFTHDRMLPNWRCF